MSTRLPPVRQGSSMSQRSGASRGGGAQYEEEPAGGYEAYVPSDWPPHTSHPPPSPRTPTPPTKMPDDK